MGPSPATPTNLTFAYVSLLAAIALGFIGEYVYRQDKEATANRLFAFICGLAVVVRFGEFMWRQTDSRLIAYLWLRPISPLWMVFIPTMTQLAIVVTSTKQRKNNWLLVALYLPAIIMYVFVFLNTTAPVETYWGFTYALRYAWLSPLQGIWVVIYEIITIAILVRGIRRSTGVRRRQIVFVLIGVVILYIGGILESLERALKLDTPNPLAIGYLLMAMVVGYAISKYKLFTINPVKIAENIVTTITDCLILINPQGVILEANQAASALLGYGKNELLGDQMDVVFKERKSWALLQNQIITDRHPVQNFETVYRKKSGELLPVLFSGSVIIDDEGREAGIVSIAKDITNLKAAEAALKESKDELEIKVDRRTAELQESNRSLQMEAEERKKTESALSLQARELARSNIELEQFAYVASHDLQEPLRMVSSYVQLLAKRYKGKLDKSADEFIEFAADGAVRMKALIDDLLAYSRVTTKGKLPVPADCSVILEEALLNLKASIEESGAVITSDPLPTVTGDPLQLGQVFQNLLGNAIKFRGDSPPQIHVSAQRQELEWVFYVKDNGIGIEPQFYDRIFMVFQRLSARDAYPGTGIGLALCKKIIERHGGRIWVESEAGKGSTFYFTVAA